LSLNTRTPEYLGKKIEAKEVKMAMLAGDREVPRAARGQNTENLQYLRPPLPIIDSNFDTHREMSAHE
jgi:hypothetical protein